MNKLIEALEGRMKSLMPVMPFIAIVESPPPNITIKYENNIIPTAQIKVMNYLLPNYHRTYRSEGIIDSMHQDVSEYSFDNSTASEAVGSHPAHPIPKLAGSGTIESTGNYEHHGDIWLTDTLRVGSEVLVQVVGNSYVITGQVVQMPNNAKEGA